MGILLFVVVLFGNAAVFGLIDRSINVRYG